jgi:hypothetical protein
MQVEKPAADAGSTVEKWSNMQRAAAIHFLGEEL